MKKKRGRPADPYTMWLCWHLACEVDEETDFLPQHKQRVGAIGGFTVVGDRLNLSPEAVEYHARNARQRRETEEGRSEYLKWREYREKQWWHYHVVCVEKRDLSLTRKDHLDEAQTRLKDASGEQDYKAWLALYERRDEKGRSQPLGYRIFPPIIPSR
jgi:hypothetical protein